MRLVSRLVVAAFVCLLFPGSPLSAACAGTSFFTAAFDRPIGSNTVAATYTFCLDRMQFGRKLIWPDGSASNTVFSTSDGSCGDAACSYRIIRENLALGCTLETVFIKLDDLYEGALPMPNGDAPVGDLRILDPLNDPNRVEIHYDFRDLPAPRTITVELLPYRSRPQSTFLTSTNLPEGPGMITVDLPHRGGEAIVKWSSCGRVLRKPVKLEDKCCPDNSCSECALDPIKMSSGSMSYSDSDPLPGSDLLPLRRTYDSSSEAAGLFGRRWTSPLDANLTFGTEPTDPKFYAMVEDGSGGRYLFVKRQSSYVQISPPPAGAPTTLVYSSTTATYTHTDSAGRSRRLFDVSGRLTGIVHVPQGRTIDVTYAPDGTAMTVADRWGNWTWQIALAGGRVSTIAIGPLSWTYLYTGDDLTSVISPAGPWRTYEFAGSGDTSRLTVVRDQMGHAIETHRYDAQGRALDSSGPSGEADSLTYWGAGREPGEYRTTILWKNGRVQTYYLRSVAGQLRTVEVTGGCETCGSGDRVVAYDRNANVVREQNARGYVTSSTYDISGRRVRQVVGQRPAGCDPETDPARCRLTANTIATASLEATPATTTTDFSHDGNWPNRVDAITTSSVLQPGGVRVESFSFDATSGIVRSHKIAGWWNLPPNEYSRTETTYVYSGTEDAAFAPGGAFDAAWVPLPQPKGLVRAVNGMPTTYNDTTYYVYYPVHPSVPALWRGRLAAVKDYYGRITRYENYDAFGNAEIVDANGARTSVTVDGIGRIVTHTSHGMSGCDTAADPLCANDIISSMSYANLASNFDVATDPRGAVTVTTYDDRSRVAHVSRGFSTSDLRERMEITYDPATGNKQVERLLAWENGGWIEKKRETYSYDSFARLERITHADGTYISHVYGPDGAIVEIANEAVPPARTRYAYDAVGRLESVSQSLASAPSGWVTTSYGYDAAGNLILVRDPNGNETTYLYDDFGEMIRQVSPVTGTTLYTYHNGFNVKTAKDANGATATYSYDALERPTTTTSTRTGMTTETVRRTYDQNTNGIGRLTTMTDPAGTTAYRYDHRGRLLSETRTMDTRAYVTSFRYDAAGNRTSITYPNGVTYSYTYDHANRPVSITDSSGAIALGGAKYLPFGPLQELTYGTAKRVMEYDARYRMTANRITDAANVAMAAYTYAYDFEGNLTQVTDVLDPGYNRTYGYDDLNRLVTANTGAALWQTGTYEWDAMGNMQRLQLGALPPGRSTAFTYSGTTPVLTGATMSGVLQPLEHDPAGNETRFATTRTYSPRNYLSSVTDAWAVSNPRKITYGYDGRGVRVIRADMPSGSTVASEKRYFTYSPELQLLQVAVDPQPGTATPVLPVQHTVVWFDSLPVALNGSYLFTDHLNTPILQFGANGVTWRAEYEPFGDVWLMRAGTPSDQPLRFPGQELEKSWSGTEERYNVFRWYRSGWGRYTQADPDWNSRRIREINHYGYVSGNPARFTDRLGLRVDLNCRPVGWGGGFSMGDIAGMLGAKHCYLSVSCDGRNGIPPTTVSYLGNRTGVEIGSDYLSPRMALNWNRDVQNARSGEYDQYEVKAETECCDFERCILRLARELDQSQYSLGDEYDAAFGPNSNSVARRLVRQCGVDPNELRPRGVPGW